MKTLAGVVVNDEGVILPYTVSSTVSQVEEESVERWGGELWERMKMMGARVVQCEIVVEEK